jgi:hypothetical protein
VHGFFKGGMIIMIQYLQRIVVENHDNGKQVTILPSNEEMMNKINEIITAVNKQEKKIQDEKMKRILGKKYF